MAEEHAAPHRGASVPVEIGASSLIPSLTRLDSPRRAGDFRSRPSAGGAGRAISASLELTAQVRPTRHQQVNNFSVGVCPVESHGCECVARANPPSTGLGGGAHIESKTRTKSLLALGRLNSFGFRKKRHQADSRDVPLTSTPTTTISAAGGRAFLLPSKPAANPLSHSSPPMFRSATRMHPVVHFNAKFSPGRYSAIYLFADRSLMHRSTTVELLRAGCQWCARPAMRMTIERGVGLVPSISYGFEDAGFLFAFCSITAVCGTSHLRQMQPLQRFALDL
jgi:hypothetical protein